MSKGQRTESRKQSTTIYDIARETGSSPSTVSAALSGRWKSRRIRPETAERIISTANEMGYAINRQARGLRTARSDLIGLLIPEHDNRFFSDLAQSFTQEARKRGQCPIIIATQRDGKAETDAVQNLLSYSIDALFVAGAAHPENIHRVSEAASLPTVFLDQPCQGARSAVTDNVVGARQLTEAIFDTLPSKVPEKRNQVYLIGGDATLHASASRIASFRDVVTERLGTCRDDQIIACGYQSAPALAAMEELASRLGGLPAGLFVNSINVFESILQFLVQRPETELHKVSIGCFDYEPYGQWLRFPVHMIRQRHRQLIRTAFDLLDSGQDENQLVLIAPELYPARLGQGSGAQ
ncbi:LacI family DNA-binding transcriptional regulator [Granulosicoccus sp. 3-233]|uniref:LacI family DNA-binding transcriptional regulator n=1 Tax=Granulosicoccus sp. 3-233 TaxID=3417969 RepID=UPI003D32BCC6